MFVFLNFLCLFGFFLFYSNDSAFLSEEMTHRIKKGNRDHYAYKGLKITKLIKKYTRRKLYMTLIRPVVTDAYETWALSVWDIEYVLDLKSKF